MSGRAWRWLTGAAQGLGPTLADQVVSTSSNAFIGIVAARTLSPKQFGVFALTQLAALLVVTFWRAALFETLLLGLVDPERSRHHVVAVSWVGTGLACGLAAIVFWAMNGLEARLSVVLLLLPGAVAQDAIRYIAFADLRPLNALMSDAAWLGSSLIAVLVVRPSTEATLLAAWLSGAGIGALVGAVSARVGVSFSGGLTSLRHLRGASTGFVVEFATTVALSHSLVFALGLAATSADVGSIRGALILFGPIHTLASGLTVHTTRRLATLQPADAAYRKAIQLFVAMQMSVVVVWTMTLLLLPGDLGRAVLGETWNGAHSVLAIIGVGYLVQVLSGTAAVVIRAHKRIKLSVATRLTSSSVSAAATLGGLAVSGSATGFAAGQTIGYSLAVGVWLVALRRTHFLSAMTQRLAPSAAARVR